MKILVSGATGLVGGALLPRLESDGHEMVVLSRSPGRGGRRTILWDAAAGRLDPRDLEGFDAVVHLAGENIAGGRWTRARKAAIRDSRVQGTSLLARTLAGLDRKPAVLVSASALGYYGDRGDAILDESAPPGQGFLADVCREWEAAADPARAAGIRTVPIRIGLVLSPAGGALAEMLPPFRLGVGGPLGNGRQYMSWITLDDLAGVFRHALVTGALVGPVNGVAPVAVTNTDFSRTLARVLGRPCLLSAPGWALKLAMGEMAEALLLASTRLVPARLMATGYTFRHPDLEPALRSLLSGR